MYGLQWAVTPIQDIENGIEPDENSEKRTRPETCFSTVLNAKQNKANAHSFNAYLLQTIGMIHFEQSNNNNKTLKQ